MRLVRLVALVIVLATAYFAQYLFDTTSLADFFPAWLLTWWPPAGALTRWQTADLLNLAIWLTLLSLLSFGVLAPWWHGEQGRAYRRLPRGRASFRLWWWVAQLSLIVALLCSGVAAWSALQTSRQELTLAIWSSSLVLYALGGVIANRLRPAVVYGDSYVETVRPWDSWPYCVGLLILFAALYSFRLLDIPLRVDSLSARIGLAAEAWVRHLQQPLLATEPNSLPLPTLALTAVARLALQDNLIALRLAGVLASLFMLFAVWLIGTELFRRVPVLGNFGEVLEDDGRWIAVIAMLIAGVSIPLYHWSRVPVVLEALGLGTFGLWALLRGVRRDRPGLLGVSAVTIGWANYYGPMGLTLTIVALLFWCGIALLESKWLVGKEVARVPGGETVPVQRGVGWRGFAFWLEGIILVLMPLVVRWVTVPGSFAAQWLWPGAEPSGPTNALDAWRERLTLAVFGLNHLADATGTLHYNEHFVHALLAPLLAVSIGVLVLNIDSLVGWTLAAWIGAGIVVAALTTHVVPSWMAMLAMLPALALAIAFTIDRVRLFIMTNGGTWTLQATVYLALGVVLSAGLLGWINYYNVAQRDSDLATSVGRALRGADDRTVVVVAAKGATIENGLAITSTVHSVLQDPVVRLLASQRQDLSEIPTIDAQSWPPLSPGTRLLMAPGDNTTEMAMEAAYPNGQLSVLRDLHANPLLIVYDLYDTATQEN